MQSGQCNHFLSLTLPSVSPIESRRGIHTYTHTQRSLSGGFRLTLPFNVYMQAPVCPLPAAVLPSVFPPLFDCFIYFHFCWLFFFIAEIQHEFKEKNKGNVTIWDLHMEKPDSAQLLCFSHRESTLLVKLSAKWCTC